MARRPGHCYVRAHVVQTRPRQAHRLAGSARPGARDLLLSVPNVSEGADRAAIDAIGAAFAPARLLDVHVDPDHGRSVYTLAAPQGQLAAALAAGARKAMARIDLRGHAGAHPHVGAVDVAPVVYPDPAERGAAC